MCELFNEKLVTALCTKILASSEGFRGEIELGDAALSERFAM